MILRIKKIIINILNKHFLFIKSKKYDLIIIDDLLPVPFSPWRNYEYESLMKQYSSSKVILDFASYSGMKGGKSYDEHLEKLKRMYPLLSEKLKPIKTGTSINAKLVYMLFYNNMRKYYHHLKVKKINYGFTLYPGGGFIFYDEKCNAILKEIINDELCKFVIVSQKLTYNYLVKDLGIKDDKLVLIYGIPLSLTGIDPIASEEKKYYKGQKEKIDIVFMAHKYMPFGLDKGFDVFQNTALELIDDFTFDFHVVGNFTEKNLLYPELHNRIKFHGLIEEESFSDFFDDKDIVISPNRPNIIGVGAFDGFPLGSSIAGGINNCVMLLTNAFDESPEIFVNHIHYLKIQPSHKDVVNKLAELKSDKAKMKSLAHEGRKKIISTFFSETQIEERIKIFKKFL